MACNKNDKELYGMYTYYNEDPMAMQMMAMNNTFFKLYDGDSILYHTEINGKKTYHHVGKFKVDKDQKQLSVTWSSGNVSPILQLEKQDNKYAIKVGNSLYVKK
ncbi:hypothetical protein [Flavihumibacter sp. ZG627]|uniref:hypothetical protein n=1 Tax=Flavihumibacter sp. ZG627 TaxID=1463156 RepID=UPI0012E06B3E|nr:hypothetical protein [Flavihumibacter sp. ZG627]